MKNANNLSINIGVLAFFVWGILHIWVGFEGLNQYINGGLIRQWHLLIGGSNMPFDQLQMPTDPANIHAQQNLLLNFCLDVAGYGFLGVAVAWLLWRYSSVSALLIGFFIIGLGDLSFMFLLVTPGIIKLNLATVSGPILWFIASAFSIAGLMQMKKSEPA